MCECALGTGGKKQGGSGGTSPPPPTPQGEKTSGEKKYDFNLGLILLAQIILFLVNQGYGAVLDTIIPAGM